MDASDDLLYIYGGIESVSAAISAFHGNMNQALDETDTKFKNLIANGWTGAGANAFAGKSAQWHAAGTELAAALLQLFNAVEQTGVNMQATDNRAASLF